MVDMPVPPAEVLASKTRRRRFAVIGVIFICIGLILGGFLVSAMSRAREAANRSKCRNQIRAIGSAIFLYANEYRGAWPPDLKTLFLSQDIAPWFLFSPSVDHPYFTRADFEANSPGLAPGAPGAYIYVGNRVKPTNDDAVVLMYEPMSNHGDGFHILFADGHAEFLTGSTAQKVLAELQAGQNPPPSH